MAANQFKWLKESLKNIWFLALLMKTVTRSWTHQLSSIRDLGQNRIFLGAVQLSFLQILEWQFTDVYGSTKYPSHILHPHIPLLLKAAPAKRQTECLLLVSCILSWGNPILEFLVPEIQQRAGIVSQCSGRKRILEAAGKTKAALKLPFAMHCYKKHTPVLHRKYEDELL